MEEYKQYLKKDQTQWLLEKENPSVRYCALKELLGYDDNDEEVSSTREAISETELAKGLLSDQRLFADQDEYSTRERLYVLAELGIDGKKEDIRDAIDYYCEPKETSASKHFASVVNDIYNEDSMPPPCYIGNDTWFFIKLGYLDDHRTQKGIQWILKYGRFDDGDLTRYPDWMKPDKAGCWGKHSCIYGVSAILKALAEISPCKRSPEIQDALDEGAEFLLKHHVYRRSHNLEKPMNQRITRLGFPDFNHTDFLTLLLILTKVECRDARMDSAVNYLIRKQNKEGKWKMQRYYNDKQPIKLGKKGMPSKWITLRAHIALKRYFSLI